jgi:hypothetical protein
MKPFFIPTSCAYDWQSLLAQPQLHWKKGASAMTLAGCWESSEGSLPTELASIFKRSEVSELQNLEVLAGFPEYPVRLPGGSTASQTDLLAIARNDAGLTVIAVEGKVEETAGPTLAQKREEASAGVKARLQALHDILALHADLPGAVRYQFLHRCASALLTAKQYHAQAAVMVIHSFSGSSTGYEDFELFCTTIGMHAAKDVVLRYPGASSPQLYLVWCSGDIQYSEREYLHGARLNPFLDTRKLTDSKEDHLTEFMAGALAISASFRRKYSELVLSRFAAEKQWTPPEIVAVETQVPFNDGRDNPDLVLRLSDGHSIAVEHKIGAQETVGPDSDEPDQLRRYLSIAALDGLVYVRGSFAQMRDDIVKNPKYVRPREGTHFLWRDFYPLLESEGGWFFHWLTEGFSALGFRPPHPKLGNYYDPEDRRNFAKFWDETRRIAGTTYGWRVTTGAIAELYLDQGVSPLAEIVWINPEEFALLRFRVTPKSGRIDELFLQLEQAVRRAHIPLQIEKANVQRKLGSTEIIDITTPMTEVLGKNPKSIRDFESRLRLFVEPLLAAIDGRDKSLALVA